MTKPGGILGNLESARNDSGPTARAYKNTWTCC